MDELITGFTAEAYLQAGWRAGIGTDRSKLLPLHGPGGDFICTMSESVLAGDMVAVEKLGESNAIGRNVTPEEAARLHETPHRS